MVRGRRARVNELTTHNGVITHSATAHAINGSRLLDDQFCASPKRKDCKIDEVTKNGKKCITSSLNGKCEVPCSTKATRSKTIKNYFKSSSIDQSVSNEIPNDAAYMNNVCCTSGIQMLETDDIRTVSIDLSEDNSCDEYLNYKRLPKKNGTNMLFTDSNMTPMIMSPKTTNNIFLQEPVLSLDVDKSLNQPSSIKINKTLEVDPIFPTSNGYHATLNGHFSQIVRLSNSPKRESIDTTTNIPLSQDSNSCDSGVVIDNKLELSPSRRRKPTTPHRIVCPSPAKHVIIEKASSSSSSSPSSLSSSSSSSVPSLVNCSLINGIGSPPPPVYGNGIQRKNPKSKRRLNTNQSENSSSSMKSPPLIGGIKVTEETLNKLNGIQKSVLNSAINPTAVQNTNNNYKKRINGQHGQRQSRNHLSSGINKELTDYFPVRRSVRKTKRAVQEEKMKSIEEAILEEREEGLKIENFEGKGRGIVTARHFKRGEFVVEYIGDLITMGEANQREKKYSLDENAGCYMYYFKHRNQQYCIDATAETGKLGRLVNHSRNGNLITKIVVVKNRPHLVLIAKDDIKPGEEITYDYGDRSKESLLHHPWLAL